MFASLNTKVNNTMPKVEGESTVQPAKSGPVIKSHTSQIDNHTVFNPRGDERVTTCILVVERNVRMSKQLCWASA